MRTRQRTHNTRTSVCRWQILTSFSPACFPSSVSASIRSVGVATAPGVFVDLK